MGDPDDAQLEELIDQVVLEMAKQQWIPLVERLEMAKSTFNSLRRYDVLQPLIDDPEITEIMVNGRENIFVEMNGQIYKTDTVFESDLKLEDVIQNIVAKVNRVVNTSEPICDARLPDGSRVSIVLPPVALDGPILTIRKFSDRVIDMDRLIDLGTISPQAAVFLNQVVLAKCNLFISGGTGTGKTTLLNILSNFIPSDERLITIEDSAELNIKNCKNLVRMETKNDNIEGKGAITIKALIKASLRMRPDRIVVGEVRGGEALDMLQAMNTGHEGSLSTGHANSSLDMLSRLETMIITQENIPIRVLRTQIASALDIMVHLGRGMDKKRYIMEISEVGGIRDDEIVLNPIFIRDENGGRLLRTANALIKRGEWDDAVGNQSKQDKTECGKVSGNRSSHQQVV